jgi:bilirubin oxidase
MKKILSIAMVLITTSTLTAQTQNPLLIPPTLTGPNYNLIVDYDSLEIFPGFFTQTAGVNGAILGPTLIINKGDVVTMNVENRLIDTTTMHWHGVHLPSAMDGGPHSKIYPNTTWVPTWIAMDRASTMWYHPHLHHKTYKHVMMGVSGLIINRDTDEAALALPRTYGVDDIPLVLQTKVMDANYQIDTDMMNSAMDTLFLANATRNAYFDAPAQVVRFRILNGSPMRVYNLGLSNGNDFWVIGSDGGLLSAPVQNNRLLIAPGERYEILVDLSGMQGQNVSIFNYGTGIPSSTYGAGSMMGGGAIQNYNNNPLNGADFTLLSLNVIAQTSNPITTIPVTLVSVNPYSQTNIDENRQFNFTSTGGQSGPFLINGNTFDMSQVNHVIPLNNKEIWSFTNQTPIAHPFHIHDIQFNILEINGAAPPLHMQGWKDILLIPGHQGNAKFIAKFDDFADANVPFMYHCHMLVHEDEGMMGQFTVVDNGSTAVETIETETFSIYPNPANDKIQVKLKNSVNQEIQIIDVKGGLMFQGILTEMISTIDVRKLSNGIYFIKAGSTTTKFIKQ